jgi:prepilin-type N-terminal cleavage/methylation domain-containing protein
MNARRKDEGGPVRRSSRSSQLRCFGGRRRVSEGGFTLIEMLVAIGIVSLVLALGALAFAEVIRLRGAQDRYNLRLTAADFLLRRIARDVRPGRAFLAGADGSAFAKATADKFAAGADTMIVSTGEATVVYRASFGKVERIEIRKGKVERGAALDAPGVKVAFDFEGAPAASARSVVTTAEWTEPPSIGVSRPTLSLRVALRNSNSTVNEP